MTTKVCISGTGTFSPLGTNEQEMLSALHNGMQAKPPFGQVPDFDPSRWIPNKKSIKLLSRQAVLGCVSVGAAIHSAHLEADSLHGDDVVLFGGGVWTGSLLSMQDAILPSLTAQGQIDYDLLCSQHYRNLAPLWILPLLPNTTAGQISIPRGLKGLNLTIVNGPSSGFSAVGEAFACLRYGRAKRAICGGAEGTPPTDLLFNLTKRGLASQSSLASRPFDPSSDGFYCSEAGVALVLEAEDCARARGIRPRAQIRSYLSRYIPRLRTSTPAEVASNLVRFIQTTLDAAAITAKDIDFVQASATGVPPIDYAEYLALSSALGASVPVTTAFGAAGHCLAAAGPLSIACALLQLEHDFVAPVTRSHVAMHTNELAIVTEQPRHLPTRRCLITSLDYTGTVSCMILERAEQPS